MTDLPALPPGLFDFLGHWAPPDPSTVPARVRLHRGLYDRIRANNPPPESGAYPIPSYHIGTVGTLLGLAVDVDDTLEPGVWQVYAVDDSLLRDSRSTNEVTS